MKIWSAIDIENQIPQIRQAVLAATTKLGIENLTQALTLHVSLRITFDIPDQISDQVIQAIKHYLSSIKSFTFNPSHIECQENIIWIRMHDCPCLTEVHQGLCQMLQAKFSVPLMEFDNCFIFHSTLALFDSNEKASQLFSHLKDLELPTTLTAKTFLIGTSETGDLSDLHTVYTGPFA